MKKRIENEPKKQERIMFRLIVSVLLLFFAVASISCSDYEKEFKAFIKKEDVHIFGVAKLTNTVIVILKSGKDYDGDFLIAAYSKNDKLLNIEKGYFNSSYYPFYYDDKYFVIAAYNESISRMIFIVYNEESNNIIKLRIEQGYIADVIILNDNLYYSTEKTESCVRRINIRDGKEIKYRIDEPNARFYIVKDKVYIKHKGQAYSVEQDGLASHDISLLDGKSPIAFKINELRNEDLLSEYKKYW